MCLKMVCGAPFPTNCFPLDLDKFALSRVKLLVRRTRGECGRWIKRYLSVLCWIGWEKQFADVVIGFAKFTKGNVSHLGYDWKFMTNVTRKGLFRLVQSLLYWVQVYIHTHTRYEGVLMTVSSRNFIVKFRHKLFGDLHKKKRRWEAADTAVACNTVGI